MLVMNGDEVQVYYEISWDNVISELLDQYPVLLFNKINIYGFTRDVSSLEDLQEITTIINTWGPV